MDEKAHKYVSERYSEWEEISVDDVLGVYEAYKDGYEQGRKNNWEPFIAGIFVGSVGLSLIAILLVQLKIIH